jgi:hypothetical protein
VTRRTVLALAATLAALTAQAQQSSPDRVRAFAALPNWSGLWETDTSAALISGEIARAAASRTRESDDRSAKAGLDPVAAEFFGRTKILGKPPYNAEWQRRSQTLPQHPGPPPAAKVCSEGGFPIVMDSPTPDGMFETVVTPEETLFLFPDGEARHVYTDGRRHPDAENLWPTQMGDSIGHWEGATLVIDTIARKAGPVVPFVPGVADLSAHAHFTERVRRLDANNMEDDLTIDDPQRFEHPWNLSIHYKRIEDLDRMIAVNCTDDDRNPVVNGQFTITPPKGGE